MVVPGPSPEVRCQATVAFVRQMHHPRPEKGVNTDMEIIDNLTNL